MPIPFTCPACGHFTQVDERYAGQSGPCSNCRQIVTIPSVAGGAPLMGAPAMAAPVMTNAPVSSGRSGMSIVMIVLALLGGGAILVILALVALLLPAVGAAREAARRVQCSNNVKQIVLAMYNYQDAYGSFPPAYTVDANGKKLHSWRTLILPYLEQDALFRQINLNEPWDSPSNAPFAQMAGKVFHCPSHAAGDLGSSYVLVVGPKTIFDGNKGKKLFEITDGTSNTVMVVEWPGANKNWMEPTDLDLNLFVQGAGTGGHHKGTFTAGFADGSVRSLSSTTDPGTRQAMGTAAGGEVLMLP